MCEPWFKAWLKRHQEINPHKEWRTYEAPGFEIVYAGWIKAFDDHRIDYPDATDASEAMQRDEEKLYPEHHLARVLKLARAAAAQYQAQCRQAEIETQKKKQAKLEARDKQIRQGWLELEEATREEFREIARQEQPILARFRNAIELLARTRWAEESRARKLANAST